MVLTLFYWVICKLWTLLIYLKYLLQRLTGSIRHWEKKPCLTTMRTLIPRGLKTTVLGMERLRLCDPTMWNSSLSTGEGEQSGQHATLRIAGVMTDTLVNPTNQWTTPPVTASPFPHQEVGKASVSGLNLVEQLGDLSLPRSWQVLPSPFCYPTDSIFHSLFLFSTDEHMDCFQFFWQLWIKMHGLILLGGMFFFCWNQFKCGIAGEYDVCTPDFIKICRRFP